MVEFLDSFTNNKEVRNYQQREISSSSLRFFELFLRCIIASDILCSKGLMFFLTTCYNCL